MAVRTSTHPTGALSQSEFDALLRREIARAGGRGGETDTQGARDRLAKRLNREEGLGRTSSAYKPKRETPTAQGARGRGASRGGAGRGNGGSSGRGTSGADGAGAENVPIPRPRPDDVTAPADDGVGTPWWLPLIALASRRGQRMMGGGAGAEPEFLPPGPRPTRVPTEPVTIDNMPSVTRVLPGQPQLPPPSQRLPYAPPVSAVDEVMRESDVNPFRYMTEEEIARAQAGAADLGRMVEGTGGTMTPSMRPNPDVNLPPTGSRTPGFYKPVLRLRP